MSWVNGEGDAAQRLPVAVVAGMCPGARRAAVGEILRTVPGAVVVHHDLTAAETRGTVRRTIRDANGPLTSGDVPLIDGSGSAERALRADLVPQLLQLAETGAYRLAVVELWDSVDPQPMAELLADRAAHPNHAPHELQTPRAPHAPHANRAEGAQLELTGVATAVDPVLVLPYLTGGDAHAFARQIEYPTVLAVAEGERAASAADHALLAQLTPAARRFTLGGGTGRGSLGHAVLAGFDPSAAAARLHPASARLPQEAGAYGVTTLVWRHRRPFHPALLRAARDELARAAVRSRGRCWVADRPDTLLSWDAAGGTLSLDPVGPWLAALPDTPSAWEAVPAERRAAAALDWHPALGDRRQHLAFTSPGLDRDALLDLLEGCLLTDAEYAAYTADHAARAPVR